jgi:ribokinase
VHSAGDPGERYEPGSLDPSPALVVSTAGAQGGWYTVEGGAERRYAAAAVPGPVADAYGAGDSFAAGLTYGLGSGWTPEAAIDLAARCGALALTRRGAYGGALAP